MAVQTKNPRAFYNLNQRVKLMDLSEYGITVVGDLTRKYKVIVPISGGKDSQACLMLALKQFDNTQILTVFCDTGFEHPITYAHIEAITKKYDVELVTLIAGTVKSICTKYERLPGGGARHCTDELKIRPSKFFYEALAKEQGGFEVWYGMRSDESPAREKRYKGKTAEEVYLPHTVLNKYPKKLGNLGVMFRLPIIDWAIDEVFALLDGEENELYSHGFSRVGCFPCLAGGEAMQMKAFHFDEVGRKHYSIAKELADLAGRPVLTTNKYFNKGPGCAFCSI